MNAVEFIEEETRTCREDKFKDLDADIWCDWQPPYCSNCGAKMDLEDTGNNNANKEID